MPPMSRIAPVDESILFFKLFNVKVAENKDALIDKYDAKFIISKNDLENIFITE